PQRCSRIGCDDCSRRALPTLLACNPELWVLAAASTILPASRVCWRNADCSCPSRGCPPQIAGLTDCATGRNTPRGDGAHLAAIDEIGDPRPGGAVSAVGTTRIAHRTC